jgi:hypothetical protein
MTPLPRKIKMSLMKVTFYHSTILLVFSCFYDRLSDRFIWTLRFFGITYQVCRLR